MDNGKPPDTNVVRLRRNGDPSDEERQRLASTIFAEQDEIGTFSRGNLVPPAPTAPPASDEPSAADPFFEQLQAPPTSDKTQPATVTRERDATDAYFDRLGSQTPAEMSQTIAPQPAAAAMPGSANLAAQLETPRRRTARHRSAIASSSGRMFSVLQVRVAAPPLLGVLGALIVAGAAFAAIVGGGGGHRAPATKPLATKQASAPLSHHAAHPVSANLWAALARPSARHQSAPRRASHSGRRYSMPKVHIVLAADHRATGRASSASGAVTPAAQSSSPTVQPSPVVQQPAAAPVAETTGGSGSSASSGAGSRPAFGANGTLGPGHSPNG
jgi:hypothetical protein